MDAQARWEKFSTDLGASLPVGRRMVNEGKAYIYRVARTIYTTAFGQYLVNQEGDEWRDLFAEALGLFALSVEKDDFQARRDYPFNLAGLLVEWHLGQWLMGQEPDPLLLDRSINLFAEGLWGKKEQPLGSMVVLPPGYLLRQDGEHLAAFWAVLVKQLDLSRLPDELALWRSWSESYLAGEATPAAFWAAYDTYARRLKDPTDQSARFFLSAAKIGQDSFGLTDSKFDILRRLAIVPWDKAKK